MSVTFESVTSQARAAHPLESGRASSGSEAIDDSPIRAANPKCPTPTPSQAHSNTCASSQTHVTSQGAFPADSNLRAFSRPCVPLPSPTPPGTQEGRGKAASLGQEVSSPGCSPHVQKALEGEVFASLVPSSWP